MSITEILERVRHAVFPVAGLPENRPSRRALHIHEMDDEIVLALQSANVDHLGSKPRRLTD